MRPPLVLLAGALAWLIAAGAAAEPSRVGVLMASVIGEAEDDPRLIGLRQGLAALGWTDGQNLRIDVLRKAAGGDDFDALAKELLERRPAVLVGHTVAAARALRRHTATVPIVGVLIADPVANGLVASLARPGGNVTGFANFEPAIGGKWLSLLKEVAPGVTRAGFIFNPATSTTAGYLQSARQAATSLGIEVIALAVHQPPDIERAIAGLAGRPGAGLIVPPDVFLSTHGERVVELVGRHRIPAIYAYRAYADRGGLLVYGLDPLALYRQAAAYVDRLLRGVPAAELPVQYPTGFQLVLNLKAAQLLGLAIPDSITARADEVIE